MFTFVSRRLSLDFAATLAFRHRAEPSELLIHPEDVVTWAHMAGTVDAPLRISEHGLASTRALREAIYTLALDTIQSRAHSPAIIHKLNTIAAAPPVTISLSNDGLHRTGTLKQLHSSLARDALDLVGGKQLDRLKECAGTDCTRLYLDTSRNATRRWCGMKQCGDKAKSAAYRTRRHTR